MIVIIYPFNETIAVVSPTGEVPLEEVIRSDIPAGAPYLLIQNTDLPPDLSERQLWQADFSNPDGYGGQ